MRPISSVITGLPSQGLPAENPTGAAHGGTGSAVSSTVANRDMHPAVTARSPAQNTALAQSRMLQFGVTASVKMETVFPTAADGDTTFRQRPTSLTVSLGSSNDLAAALAVANESLRPAPVEAIEEWLARLSVKTARRKDSAQGDELALSVYTDHLRAYPADAVRFVLTNYRGQWFPTWGELAERLDEYTDPRLMIRDRLEDMARGKPQEIAQAPTLAQLRGELAALDKMLLRFPETACEKSDRLRAELVEEVERLERVGAN